MEAAIELETSPDLSLWAWYTGAHQQYHYGFLLLLEIFAFPMRKEADRIWACLDYIFEVPPHLSREQKGRWILTEIRDKTKMYQSARKVRAPTGLTNHFGQQSSRTADIPIGTRQSSVGTVQQFTPSTATLSNGLVARDASYGHNVNVSKVQENLKPSEFVENIPMPIIPPVDDQMTDIDWVSNLSRSTLHIRWILIQSSMNGTSYSRLMAILGTPTSTDIITLLDWSGIQQSIHSNLSTLSV